jgi:hypothetical protein
MDAAARLGGTKTGACAARLARRWRAEPCGGGRSHDEGVDALLTLLKEQ